MNTPLSAQQQTTTIGSVGLFASRSCLRMWLGLSSALFLCSLGLSQEQLQTQTRRFDPNAAGDSSARDREAPSLADAAPSFAAIQHAENDGHYHLHQVRRILDGKSWLSVREELWTAPGNSGGTPRFKLSLEDIDSRELSEGDLEVRRAEFSSRSSFLFLHTACRIVDSGLAERNYQILDLGPGMRIDRPIRKVLLSPIQPGSTPWLLELDLETGYPLYRAEYDQRGQVAATLEVTEFEHGSAARAPAGMTWWQETRSIREHADLRSGLRDFSARGVTLPDATSIPSGYELVKITVVDSDLNNEQTLVQSYSDGIDEIFLLTTINSTRPDLLDNNPGREREVNLMIFHDLNTSQLMFYHGDLRYQLIGRPAAGRLKTLARSLIRSAFR